MTTELSPTMQMVRGTSPSPPSAVKTSIPETHLFAYRQAANELGMVLRVVGKGKPFDISEAGTAIVAKPGNVGINYFPKKLFNDDGTRYDFSGFSIRVKELIKEAQE